MRNSLASILGFAALVLPESAPWSLFLTLLTALLYIEDSTDRKTLLIRAGVAGSVAIAVSGLLIPAPLATAILAACCLGKTNPFLTVSILAFQSSYFGSLEALLANHLHPFQLEAASPAIIAGLVALCIQPTTTWWKIALPVLCPLIVLTCQRIPIGPDTLAALASLPALVLAGMASRREYSTRHLNIGLALSVLLIVIGSAAWFNTPPRSTAERYVILSNANSAPESKYYANYVDAANFAGLSLRSSTSLDAIPQGSLLLLPWLTSPLEDNSGKSLLPTIRELARSRGWTVILVGEHTNMTGVADNVASLLGFSALRNDLTVPPGNTDDSGPLRVGNFRAWPHNSIFNRGASVEIKSIFDKILLSGDGWWAEPDIGEWLWVGDYQWRPSDRHGRLSLAASFEDGAARWIVVGDTSPFVNRQLIADPRAAAQLIQMASLWPMFFRDLWLAFSCLVILLIRQPLLKMLSSLIVWIPLAVAIVLPSSPGPWKSIWQQQSAFDERNFNTAILSEPRLLRSRWSLIRQNESIQSLPSAVGTPTVVFGLIGDVLRVGSASLGKCHRIGNVKTDEGPFLMDAQSCEVSGDADVLIGDRAGAAAVRFNSHGVPTILILDRNFLSQNAPPENAKWLGEIISKAH